MKRNVLIVALAGWAGWGTAALVDEGFESYPEGTPLTTLGAQGWGASGANVIVQTNRAWGGAKAAGLPAGSSASNTVSGAPQRLWVDFRCLPTQGSVPLAAGGSNRAVRLFVNFGGFATVATSAAVWVSFPLDVWGAAVPAVSGGAWARLTLHADFTARRSALFVNGRLVGHLLPFAGEAASAFRRFGARTPAGSAWLDDLYVDAEPPASLTNDWDGDLEADAATVQRYGYMPMIRRVGAGQRYLTLGAALADANDRDRILVAAGTYVENPVVTDAVTLTGSAFTVSGTLTVSDTTNAVLATNLTATAVTITNGATLRVVNARLTCTTLSIAPGARLRVEGGVLSVGAETLSGTFVLQAWGPGLTAMAPPYAEGFEPYAAGRKLSTLGFQGWSATADADQVQTAVLRAAAKAAALASASTVTLEVAASAPARMWTDLWLKPTLGLTPTRTASGTTAFRLYFDTNGYPVVASPQGWQRLTTSLFGAPLSRVSNAWVRVSVHSDYEARRCALFLDGVPVLERLPFCGAGGVRYGRMGLSGANSPGWFDDVALGAVYPADLAGDADHDGNVDAWEIDRAGTIRRYPAGSVVAIR